MKPRVLIVDDEPDVLELVGFRLSTRGFEVLTAGCGLEGLRQARCGSPDVIVLDMMLPDIDGFTVCEILRAQPSTRDVPVVIFSALERPLARASGAKIQVSHWLKKGSNLELLCESVGAAVEEHMRRIRGRLVPEDVLAREPVG